MNTSLRLRLAVLAAALVVPAFLRAEIPDAVPYQGRVAVGGVNFTGTGQFKFAIYQHATGDFTPAVATATLTNGMVTGVVIVSGGSGYSASGVTVSFNGTGTATGTVTVDAGTGAITGVTVQTSNNGFTAAPTVTFIDPTAPTQLWNNAIGALPGAIAEPASAISLPVTNGLYTVGLGDTALANMEDLPASLAPATGHRLFVRIWFNDGTHGFQQLAPDTELRSVPFAREAASVSGIAANATTASGTYATALGDHTQATGYGSTALGVWTAARGIFATALGLGTSAESYGETVIGSNNIHSTPVSATTWAPADRLFVIGNGTSDTARSDALVMRKSGQTTINSGTDGLTVTGPGPLAGNPATDATVPVSGAGTRMMFLPGYGAFRAGTVVDAAGTAIDESKAWDTDNMGTNSTAFGYNTTASGATSTALGYTTTASGAHSTAMGSATTASGHYSTASGYLTIASGDHSTALGYVTIASGIHSTASGYNSKATAECSTALGNSTTASGYSSTALGNSTTASGDSSTALGAATNAESFYETVIGHCDTLPTTTPSAGTWVPTDRLFVIGNGTSDSTRSDALVVLKNGNATLYGTLTANSFVTTSDRNRKTAIVPVDTAAILTAVAALPVSTWKFNDETATHLGPMAQDFFAAFHLGDTDTGIASVDADGVALAAIQELKKQLDAKEARIAQLEREQAALAARLAALEARLK